jgi:DNA modification methylase
MIVDTLFKGDSEQVLQTFTPEMVDLTFCSPPYFNIREYSQYMSYDVYLETMCRIFNVVYQVTKEGRFLVINVSPVIEPRIDRQHQSKRYPIPFDITHLLTKDGKWDFIEDIVWEKPEPSVKNRNGQFFQHRKPLSYKPNIVHEYVLVFRRHTDKLIDWNIRKYSGEIIGDSKVEDGYEKTSIWKIPPKSSKYHPAIFPEELAERVIKYYSMAGDIILDPFSGIGTTCKAAKRLKKKYIGIELNEKYYQHTIWNIAKD